MTISEQLRHHAVLSSRTVAIMARSAKIDKQTLFDFIESRGELTQPQMDALAELFRLRLVRQPLNPPPKRRKRA